MIDLQISKSFKKLEIKFIAQDILNQPFRRAIINGKKFNKETDLITYSSQKGQRFQLAINFKL